MNGYEGRRFGTPAAVLGILLAAAVNVGRAERPPDLRLEWLDGDRATRQAEPVSGVIGETVGLRYQLRNIGGGGAFAALLTAHTTLGPHGESERLQPGPAAGDELPRHLELPLARGMRHVCLEVRLQTLNADDSQDPNPSDNRLCRGVVVHTDDPQSTDGN